MVPLAVNLVFPGFLNAGLDTHDTFLLEVTCNQGSDVHLRVNLQDVNYEQEITLYVSDKSRCRLSTENIDIVYGNGDGEIGYRIFDRTPTKEEHNVRSDASSFLMREGNLTPKDNTVELPALYGRCLKSALVGAIDEVTNIIFEDFFYDGSYRDLAIDWLNDRDFLGTSYCSVQDTRRLAERYALVAMSFAQEFPDSTETWISGEDHCQWQPWVACNDKDYVIQLNYGKCCRSLIQRCPASLHRTH